MKDLPIRCQTLGTMTDYLRNAIPILFDELMVLKCYTVVIGEP